jgi:predicted alpha/beta hydrolase family esterase
MPKQVLFIQGAGQGAYEADAKLVENLRHALGVDYEIIYPTMPNEADASYDEWKQCIERRLATVRESVILVGHSVGASILLKCLSEIKVEKPVAGTFLMAAPFWGGNGWRYEGYEKLELLTDLVANLPQRTPLFLYHCRDDDIVPYEHLTLYEKLLSHATTHPLGTGGHQFNNDLSPVAQDIRSLKSL